MTEDDWVTFRNALSRKLDDIHTPECISCADVQCKNLDHIHDIDDYAFNIMAAMEEVIVMTAGVKTARKSNEKVVPGWSDLVKPFKEQALFWHSVWILAGKPLNNHLHNIMKRTRNIYHYQIRKCRRSVETVKKNKLLNACVNGNGEIFDELKKLR